eukprot:TRINITY_DN248_c0_g3_i1.p1 TRINITY_DN248_c0_g3~~TRINITY_DN248_c0_g3_i1.p1  ORF type:complete len:190 (+),score=5.08 TRINITY_DN248_c0_g3_i1:567-1136(+)
MKDMGYMTLAIGDGGNDVSMIQQAHVGVAILGREGKQATRAADYTISSREYTYFYAIFSLPMNRVLDGECSDTMLGITLIHINQTWSIGPNFFFFSTFNSILTWSGFRFLRRLLLVHGRLSYYRTSFIAQYCFYKSLIIGFIQVSYGNWSAYSGSSFFNSFCLTTYNILFTGIPIFFYCLLFGNLDQAN